MNKKEKLNQQLSVAGALYNGDMIKAFELDAKIASQYIVLHKQGYTFDEIIYDLYSEIGGLEDEL